MTLIMLAACGCQPSPPAMVVGHVADFSGPDKDLADQAAKGIQLALEDYAATNPPRPIAVRHVDDKGSADATEGQAVRLASLNHAAILLGGQNRDDVLRLDRSGAIVIAPVGGRDKGMDNLVVATGVASERRGTLLGQHLKETKDASKLILLVQPGDEFKQAESAFVAALGTTPPRHALGDAASDSIKTWAEKLPKDALPVIIASPEALKSLALDSPLRDRAIAYVGPEIARRPLKDRQAPIDLVTAFAGPKADEFGKRFEAKFHWPAEPHAALAYDDARLAFDLLKRSWQKPSQLREELKALAEFQGVTGTSKITDGVLDRPAFVGRLQRGVFSDAK